ncbi:MAG: creatininase family protein [Chloroflexi bacterium]|nr:creatininase family protein [Chloroflexota bacterium]
MALEEISYRVRGAKLLHEMTFEEVEALLKVSDVALLSFGAIEQHGGHLPLGTDTFIAEETVRRVLSKLAGKGHSAVGAVIPVGISHKFLRFPGSITLGFETFVQAHLDICESLFGQGFRKFAIVCGNGGNATACRIATDRIAMELKTPAIFVDALPYQFANKADVVKDPAHDKHAGEAETSKILAVHPELVHLDRADDVLEGAEKSGYGTGFLRGGGDWREEAERGYLGRPNLAEASTGDKLYEMNSDWIVNVVIKEFFE